MELPPAELVHAASAAPPIPDPLAPTIFHEPWWLDLVAPNRWRAAESHRHGRLAGRLPYLLPRRSPMPVSAMPPFTHVLGPALAPAAGSPNTQSLTRLAVTRDLIAQLPATAAFRQTLHCGLSDSIAFQMEGFETSVQFTHALRPQSPAAIWAGMRDKTRNAARQGASAYRLDPTPDPAAFCALYRANIAARQLRPAFDLAALEPLIAACAARARGQALIARARCGAAKAGIFTVWDQTTCYYLLSTRAPDSGNGAITHLLWHAIQRAAASGLTFDFDGLGASGAVLFYAGFGAAIRPRYTVFRLSPAYRLLKATRRLLTRPRPQFA